MKRFLNLLFLLSVCTPLFAQEFASSYHPKNNTEKLVLKKINALPEIKEWLSEHKKSEPDIIIGKPDSKSKYYSFQVGLSNVDMFRTSYWLYVDPKTFEVYYWDELNESDHPNITLQQWRHWRKNPGFQKRHIFKSGKLVVLGNDKKKSSKS